MRDGFHLPHGLRMGRIHRKDDAFHDFEFIDRLPFYKTAEDAFVIVQTGDESRYGNIILQKGVC